MGSKYCETCVHFENDVGSSFFRKHGECRRYPPRHSSLLFWLLTKGGGDWPDTRADKWCGEYKPKEETK